MMLLPTMRGVLQRPFVSAPSELMPTLDLWTPNGWTYDGSGSKYLLLIDSAESVSRIASSPAFNVTANATKTLSGYIAGYGWGTGVPSNPQTVTLQITYYTAAGGTGSVISSTNLVASAPTGSWSIGATVPSNAISAKATLFNTGGTFLGSGCVMYLTNPSFL